MQEEVRNQGRTSVRVTDQVPLRVCLHQGSSLPFDLFDPVTDLLNFGIKEQSPWGMLFAEDLVLWRIRKEEVEKKLEEWRRALQDKQEEDGKFKVK